MSDILAAPKGLSEQALFAWERLVMSDRDFTEADLLALEAAARNWGRWKELEQRITELSGGNPLAGNLTTDGAGKMRISALRQAANEAWAAYRDIAADYGFAPVNTEAPVPEGDLFGYPDRPGRGQRGRPRFQPTARDHNRVRLLLALGWSNPRIADALEVSEPTLRKYFGVALKERDRMRDRLDARLLEVTMEQANAGNIAAVREAQKLIEKNDAAVAEAEFAKRSAPEPEKAPRLGKKEERSRAALEAEDALSREIAAEARAYVKH